MVTLARLRALLVALALVIPLIAAAPARAGTLSLDSLGSLFTSWTYTAGAGRPTPSPSSRCRRPSSP